MLYLERRLKPAEDKSSFDKADKSHKFKVDLSLFSLFLVFVCFMLLSSRRLKVYAMKTTTSDLFIERFKLVSIFLLIYHLERIEHVSKRQKAQLKAITLIFAPSLE